jgi:hypothetical protein
MRVLFALALVAASIVSALLTQETREPEEVPAPAPMEPHLFI